MQQTTSKRKVIRESSRAQLQQSRIKLIIVNEVSKQKTNQTEQKKDKVEYVVDVSVTSQQQIAGSIFFNFGKLSDSSVAAIRSLF